MEKLTNSFPLETIDTNSPTTAGLKKYFPSWGIYWELSDGLLINLEVLKDIVLYELIQSVPGT